jgi:hypothetical protein
MNRPHGPRPVGYGFGPAYSPAFGAPAMQMQAPECPQSAPAAAPTQQQTAAPAAIAPVAQAKP